MDGQQVETGNSKMIKSIAASVGGGSVKWLDEIQIIIINTLIDDCSNSIINEEDSSDLLKKLVDKLRESFESDYCAIGKVDGGFVEDYIVSWANRENENEFRIQERDLKSVNRVSLQNQKCCVCRGLKSKELYTYFDIDEIKGTDNYHVYETILGEVSNTTIIPIRNNKHENKGFIQLINSKSQVNKYDIISLHNSLLRLITLIHQRDGLKDAILFKKDYTFISNVQKKINDVDAFLKDVMEYLSKEFSAGIVSFRIPLLTGIDNKPLFFLRDCYISNEVAPYITRDDYFNERLVVCEEKMGGYKKLNCNNIEPLIIDPAKDTSFYERITDEFIQFRNDTLIIPVLRGYSDRGSCLRSHNNKEAHCTSEASCPYRFAKYFGVFKLRVLKNTKTSLTSPDLSDKEKASGWLTEETKNRLSNLAKQISILLNAIVEKYENKCLDIFQNELEGTSFSKIKEFDEQCSRIVKKSIHAKICAIYRYNSTTNRLTFSASTLPNDSKYLFKDIGDGIKQYRGAFYLPDHDKLIEELFERKTPVYYTSDTVGKLNSIMFVPMIRKDNSKLGVMLLVGKENSLKRSNLSKTFWEHDKKHIEFIVDVLTRIEESDSERLTFLSQLSHELLRPVTEMVYRNDYHITRARKDPEAYSKRMLISEIQNNVDMCMMFKYIIDDVEYIYSLSKGDVQYNFEMADFRGVILDAIRLSEEEAYNSKSLVIRTYIKQMPEELYIDKSRMRQVIINLLRNAIRYSDNHKDIIVRYEFNKKMNCHEISFEDFGLPVEKDDKDKIFGLYYRSKNASEKAPNGSGIGLYLVKQIMLAHDGDCYVRNDSYPTIFTIRIPNQK